MNIGRAIRELRTQKGFNQLEFAKRCGVSQTSMSQIENGVTQPHAKTLKSMCDALDVPEYVIHLLAVDDTDIPEKKREKFQHMRPILNALMEQMIRD